MTPVEKLASIDTSKYQILIRYKEREWSTNQCSCCGTIGEEVYEDIQQESRFSDSLEALKFLAALEDDKEIHSIEVKSFSLIQPNSVEHLPDGRTKVTWTGTGSDTAFIPHS